MDSGAAWMSAWPEAERAIHRSVRGRLPLGVEPQDVSQQVFVDLLRAGDNAPPPDRLRFWAVGVGRRVVADLYRRKSVRDEDLALAPVVDIETVALTRLRCAAAAEAYAGLRPADRSALAASTDGAPASNKVKLRRSRARRTLREQAERLVGAGLLLPRWGWLATGAAGVAAVALPLCLGFGAPGVDTAPDTAHRTPVARVPDVVPAGSAEYARPAVAPERAPAGPRPSAAAPQVPADPTYHRRISVSVPGAGPAGYDHYTPAAAPNPPPAACARNLQVSDSVCLEHPLR